MARRRPAGRKNSSRGLEEETTFVELDVDCDADLILGYDWLRSHGITVLYDTNEV